MIRSKKNSLATDSVTSGGLPWLGLEKALDATANSVVNASEGTKSKANRAERRRKLSMLLAASFSASLWFAGSADAQSQSKPKRNPPAPQVMTPKTNTPPRKLTEAEKKAQAVLNAYTDAANFQNSGAYPLAIEAWKKLLTEYPNDPLASKAKHYLGICYMQGESPNYEAAIEQLKGALEDKGLEVREETLVNLGRALFDSSRREGLKSEDKQQRLMEATVV